MDGVNLTIYIGNEPRLFSGIIVIVIQGILYLFMAEALTGENTFS